MEFCCRTVLTLFCVSSVMVASGGCSSVARKNESIVRVQTKQSPAKARRLTYAGIRALNKSEIDLAAKRFREAVEADFAYGPAHNNLGLMHFEQGNLYQAVMAFEQARELLPNDPAVVYNLGLALESAGQVDEAMEMYYTANQMDRANPNFLGNLVRLRVRMGDRDDLLEHQLQELILIETRPDWRRWADTQLGLPMNLALDRGPETPDLESTANQSRQRNPTSIQDKIIDLTPIEMASYESDEKPLAAPPKPANLSPTESTLELEPPQSDAMQDGLEEGFVEDLSEDAYYVPGQ